MTVIYFVRHAHSPWLPNQEATRPLSAEGHEAATTLASALADHTVDAVLSSPYERAVQTVQPIAEAHDLDIERVAAFRERQLTDGPAEDIGETFESAIERVWNDWTFSWPGSESNLDAQARGVAAVEQVLDAYPEGYVVIGTHGNLLTLILNYFDDRFDFEFWRTELDTPDCYRAEFSGDDLVSIDRLTSKFSL